MFVLDGGFVLEALINDQTGLHGRGGLNQHFESAGGWSTEQPSATRKDSTPIRKHTIATSCHCVSHACPRSRGAVVMPMQKPHSARQPMEKFAICPLAQDRQLHQQALGEFLIGAGSHTLVQHAGSVDDAGQPPGHGSDHAGHRRQKGHGCHRQLDAVGDRGGIDGQAHGNSGDDRNARMVRKSPRRWICSEAMASRSVCCASASGIRRMGFAAAGCSPRSSSMSIQRAGQRSRNDPTACGSWVLQSCPGSSRVRAGRIRPLFRAEVRCVP